MSLSKSYKYTLGEVKDFFVDAVENAFPLELENVSKELAKPDISTDFIREYANKAVAGYIDVKDDKRTTRLTEHKYKTLHNTALALCGMLESRRKSITKELYDSKLSKLNDEFDTKVRENSSQLDKKPEAAPVCNQKVASNTQTPLMNLKRSFLESVQSLDMETYVQAISVMLGDDISKPFLKDQRDLSLGKALEEAEEPERDYRKIEIYRKIYVSAATLLAAAELPGSAITPHWQKDKKSQYSSIFNEQVGVDAPIEIDNNGYTEAGLKAVNSLHSYHPEKSKEVKRCPTIYRRSKHLLVQPHGLSPINEGGDDISDDGSYTAQAKSTSPDARKPNGNNSARSWVEKSDHSDSRGQEAKSHVDKLNASAGAGMFL